MAALAPRALGRVAEHRTNRLVSRCCRQLARASKRGGEQTGPSPVDRSRPGSKHHVIVEAKGIPLAVTLTAANRNDVTQLVELVDRVPPVGRHGKFRPLSLYADRAYDSARHRAELRERQITPHIPKRNTGHGSGLGRHRWGGRAHDLLAARQPLPRPPPRTPSRHPRSHAHTRLRQHLPQTPQPLLLDALRHRAFVGAARAPMSGRGFRWSQGEHYPSVRLRISVVGASHVARGRARRRRGPRVRLVRFQHDHPVVVAAVRELLRLKTEVDVLADSKFVLHVHGRRCCQRRGRQCEP